MNAVEFKWIGLDWGTTHLRAFAIYQNGSVLDTRQSNKGMSALAKHDFEPALLELVEDWLTADRVIPVLASGMVGARQGWNETPYRSVPCRSVLAGEWTRVPTQDKRICVSVLPGLCQPNPSDVMRGEETQIAGYLALEQIDSAVVCLPGTHSKWASVADGIVQNFSTFMTGEIYALLSEKSILQHSVKSSAWNLSAFTEAVYQALKAPEKVAAQLFSIRSAQLLNNDDAANARSRLSGMLIGQEIAIARDYWEGGYVAVVGSSQTVPLYLKALTMAGVNAHHTDAQLATLAGLAIASGNWKGHES